MFGAADGDSALDHLDHLDLIQEGAFPRNKGRAHNMDQIRPTYWRFLPIR